MNFLFMGNPDSPSLPWEMFEEEIGPLCEFGAQLNLGLTCKRLAILWTLWVTVSPPKNYTLKLLNNENVKRFRNLRSLVLDPASPLSSFSGLPHLTSLHLEPQITFSQSRMPKYKSSSIKSQEVTQVDLSGLPKLSTLRLGRLKAVSNVDLSKLTTLTDLDLTAFDPDQSCDRISSDGILTLTNLTSLSLSGNQSVGDEALQPLLHLGRLDLSSNKIISDVGIAHLVQLTSLDISFTLKISDEGLASLVNLRTLNMAGLRRVTNGAIRHLTNLTSLQLPDDNLFITNSGLKNLTNLTWLHIGRGNLLTDDCLLGLSRISSLTLVGPNRITDRGLRSFPELKVLQLRNISLTGTSTGLMVAQLDQAASNEKLTNLLQLETFHFANENVVGPFPRSQAPVEQVQCCQI